MTALEIVEARVAAERKPCIKSKNDVLKIEVTIASGAVYDVEHDAGLDNLRIYRHHAYAYGVSLFYDDDYIRVKATVKARISESNFPAVWVFYRNESTGGVRVDLIEQYLLKYFNAERKHNERERGLVKRVELILNRDDS